MAKISLNKTLLFCEEVHIREVMQGTQSLNFQDLFTASRFFLLSMS